MLSSLLACFWLVLFNGLASGAAPGPGTPTDREHASKGAVPAAQSALGNPYHFQGVRYDPETGFYYFRNRYYDPQTGRFLQRDPVWDANNAGNAYTFAANSAASLRDPSGEFIPVLIAAAVAGGALYYLASDIAEAQEEYKQQSVIIRVRHEFEYETSRGVKSTIRGGVHGGSAAVVVCGGVVYGVPAAIVGGYFYATGVNLDRAMQGVVEGDPDKINSALAAQGVTENVFMAVGGAVGTPRIRGPTREADRVVISDRQRVGNRQGQPYTEVMAPGDPAVGKGERAIPALGFSDVFVHGTRTGFWLGNERTDPVVVSMLLLESGHLGGPIRLISCSSGRNPGGPAQRLADLTGDIVLAPRQQVWVHADGRVTVGPTPSVDTGAWGLFRPKR
ncbi:MAG: RHS repeat-associated core domain-containing protein [Verrucomicrobia bacterium]|nr:RHS repeat-associated core domain-containing protein [Verrucomicrobiota bacterium]